MRKKAREEVTTTRFVSHDCSGAYGLALTFSMAFGDQLLMVVSLVLGIPRLQIELESMEAHSIPRECVGDILCRAAKLVNAIAIAVYFSKVSSQV